MKEMRIVSVHGKLNARWCQLDKDGEVDFVSSSNIELFGKDKDVLVNIKKEFENALSKPVIMMLSGKHSGYLDDGVDWLEGFDE